MPRSANAAVWLCHLLAVEADHADDAERERLLALRSDAYDLAAELLGSDKPEAFFAAMDAWDQTPGACSGCGQLWQEMRVDCRYTHRAGAWEQRLEQRTCTGCARGRTYSLVVFERDVQELGDAELQAFIADRVSVFDAARDQRPSEAPHA